MADINKILGFSAAISGFHVYCEDWNPYENEELTCPSKNQHWTKQFIWHVYGRNMPYWKWKQLAIYQEIYLAELNILLTEELSKIISNPFQKIATISGALEIPCEGTVTMPGSNNDL